jgi:hemin uptake protein HemP
VNSALACFPEIDKPPPMANNTDQPSERAYSQPREVSSSDLLQGAKEIWIRHGEELYRLRLTRSGKLILQK